MADLTVKYFSAALNRTVTFGMYIPDGASRPMKTLFLLHGYTMSGFNWLPAGVADKYGFAVVYPDAENSFWLDRASTGHKYCTFAGKELPDFVNRTFGLANDAADTYIMGFSMGGFGALHTAFTYPERFGKTAALSSALIVHEVAGMKPGSDNGHANYEYYREVFGEPSCVLAGSANPETLVDRLLAEGKRLPDIYMSCGTEDFLLENNREFHRFLESRGVPHVYRESPGVHDFTFWHRYAAEFAEAMFG